MITVRSLQKDLPISSDSVKKAIACLLAHLKVRTDFLSVYFVTNKKISLLHSKFFKDPSPTDCITLPIDSPLSPSSPHCLGEVFICPATALAYAQKHQIDPYEETTRYLVHGILHLIGYEDTTPKLKAQMRRKETQCLKHLKKFNTSISPSKKTSFVI